MIDFLGPVHYPTALAEFRPTTDKLPLQSVNAEAIASCTLENLFLTSLYVVTAVCLANVIIGWTL